MTITAGRFTARLARDEEEVRAAQRLRYRVFVEEMGASASADDHAVRLERDCYDPHCDHLILIDDTAEPADPLDRLAGVYRLMRGAQARTGPGFYTAGEFDLAPLLAYPGEILELGRSCVAAGYRGGAAMQLLWMGLAEYINVNEIKLLFGCASFHGSDVEALALPLSFLHHNHLAPPALRARALDRHYVSLDRMAAGEIDRADAMRAIPALIKGYLRVGGYVGDGAFVDHAFNTVDVCLVMETERISDRYRQFYSKQTDGTIDRILG